jgi:hypothetical protein
MVKILCFITLLILSFRTLAIDLATGDVLLQPLNCWSCELIEQEEDSLYAHAGIVINIRGQFFVAEAIQSVHLISLEKFLQRTKAMAQVKVLRYRFINNDLRSKITKRIISLIGYPYDADFLWNNKVNGKESFYCSEFVYKVFVKELTFFNLTTKKMPFKVNPKLWDQYFHGKTPRGELGISPEDFNQSFDFFEVGFL